MTATPSPCPGDGDATWMACRAAIGAAAFAFGAAAVAQALPDGKATVRIDGSVDHPVTLGLDDLRRCAQRDVEITPPAARAGEPAPPSRRYTGCLLRDLVAVAKPIEGRPRDLRRSYLVVTARDGYQVVFSWAELFVSPVGERALVAHTRDGALLERAEGPVALVSGADVSAARHVKALQSIELRTIAP